MFKYMLDGAVLRVSSSHAPSEVVRAILAIGFEPFAYAQIRFLF